MIQRSGIRRQVLYGMYLSMLFIGCSTIRGDAQSTRRIEIFHYALNATSPIAMRPVWVIERNSRSKVVVVDDGTVSEIERCLAKAVERGKKERGIVDARIVALFQRKDSTVDTLCLSRLQFSYKGQSYRRDSALLELIVSRLGPDRQYELDEIFSRPTTSRSTAGVPLSGRVVDQATGEAIGALIVVENRNTGAMVLDVASDSTTGAFAVTIAPGSPYGVIASKQGYVFKTERFTVPISTSYDTIRQDFHLVKLARGKSFAPQYVLFGYNTATIDPESFPELNRVAVLMRENAGLRMEIAGHTDPVGSEEFCRKLSLDRAEAVRQYLMSVGGISPDRLTIRGFGYSKPVAPNATEVGRRQNRRVEFTILEY